MAVNILVIAELISGEFRKPSFEAISEARRIADKTGGKVNVIVLGSGIDALCQVPSKYGADMVIKADDKKLDVYQPDYYTAAIKQAAQDKNTSLILMPATDLGRDLAPRVAAQLKAGLAEDCLKLNINGETLEAERPMYAGKVIARVAVKSKVKVATLRPNVIPASNLDSSRTASIELLAIPEVSPKTTFREFKATEGAKIDVTEADVIITGGRGMKDAANFKILEELAGVLGGAVGATRAAVDAGWRPHSEQVGQTGKTVSPNLYMMFGASGSIQHWAGMSGAKCIVAVNKNREAPIIGKADYSIIGDLFEIVPALTQELKKIKG